MGDRIAIMREGGKVEQYATPAEILMAPATEFVEDFVGADRALKRLALMRVADIDLWEAPLAHVGQPTAEVRAKLDEPDVEVPYPLLVDGERRPLGWLSERDLRAETVPEPRRLAARPAARPRRRDARRPRRPAPGRGPVRGRGRPRGPDRRRPLGRDHLRVPRLAGGEDRGAQRRGAARMASSRRCRWRRRGEVGEGFFQERTGQVLPGEAEPPLLLGLGAGTHRPLRDADAAAARTGRDLGRARLRDRLRPGAARPPPPLAATAAAGRDRRSSTRSPASPSSCCCCRSPAAAARRRSSPSAPTRCRSSTATSPSASTTSPTRPRTPPAAWA